MRTEERVDECQAQSHRELINEALRNYEGFPEILAVLERFEDVSAGPRQGDVERLGPVIEHTHVQETLHALLATDPEMADVFQRLQSLQEERRSRAWDIMFDPQSVDRSPER